MYKIKKYSLAIIFIFSLYLTPLLIAVENSKIDYTKDYLDDSLKITVYTDKKEYLDKTIAEIDREIKRIINVFTPSKENSDVFKFNKFNEPLKLKVKQETLLFSDDNNDNSKKNVSNNGVKTLNVTPEFITLLYICKQFYNETDGAFDITIGPILKLWKKAAEKNKYPTPEEIEQTKAKVGMNNIKIAKDQQSADILTGGIELDFGAVLKGYILDIVSTMLIDNGFKNHFLTFGGSYLVKGNPNDAEYWNIDIPDPTNPEKTIYTLKLDEGSISSSAINQQSYTIEGKKYSRIIYPPTGKPVEGLFLNTTIYSRTATIADAMSTALFVMGLNRAKKFIENSKKAVLFVDNDGNVLKSPALEKMEKGN